MTERHRYYLSLGSNIQPQTNLPKAVDLLRAHGSVQAISSAWESQAVGSTGPNFINASLLFISSIGRHDLKKHVIRPLETTLGRTRSQDKNAPRTIDIDILMVDEEPCNLKRWNNAFVVLPMAELLPDFVHPLNHEKLSDLSAHLRTQTWIMRRPEILNHSNI